jgi:hypothetical protein
LKKKRKESGIHNDERSWRNPMFRKGKAKITPAMNDPMKLWVKLLVK